SEHAIKGFHHIGITTKDKQATAEVLTDILGYSLQETEVNRYRFKTDAIESANLVELVEAAGEAAGNIAAGSVHHVAFRVKDEQSLMFYREKIQSAGLTITEKIDRNYFYSLYFREPGGVLFELATDNPGFLNDESEAELGRELQLPPQY